MNHHARTRSHPHCPLAINIMPFPKDKMSLRTLSLLFLLVISLPLILDIFIYILISVWTFHAKQKPCAQYESLPAAPTESGISLFSVEFAHVSSAPSSQQVVSAAYVDPWAVEYLPNPVIYAGVWAVWRGVEAVRERLGGVRGREGEDSLDGKTVGEDLEEATASAESSPTSQASESAGRICSECGMSFRTVGLLRCVPSFHLRPFPC